MIFEPFGEQKKLLLSKARIKGGFAGKRGGKTEVGAIEAITKIEQKPNYTPNDIDPYACIIIAPTHDMLRRLSMRKFLAYAKPFKKEINESRQEVKWDQHGIVYGLSADRPERVEGIKANHIWMDEIFQMNEQMFLECLARVADTQGTITCTGSLGVQYRNPKNHWAYKHFKQKPLAGSECFEWSTSSNPHFPLEELDRLKDTLDPVTYKQMFEICWDTQGSSMVYDEFSDANILENYKYNPSLETFCVIDWGFTHQMACLYLQYDRINDTVFCFDEIVSSKLTLEKLWELMKLKPYRIDSYYCDIAGQQTREQTGISNVTWFKQPPRNIHFKFRASPILHGISIVRSYICNSRGQRRLYMSNCPKTVDGLRNYSFQEKNGIIANELPEKKDDDAVDALRYFFVNRLDFTKNINQFENLSRWKLEGKSW